MRQFLAALNRPLLRAIVLSFCAGDPEVLSRISVPEVTARIETFLFGLPLSHFLGFQFMVFAGGLRAKTLDTWSESRIRVKRVSYIGLKYICMAQIYSEHPLLEAIGYGPALRARMGQAK